MLGAGLVDDGVGGADGRNGLQQFLEPALGIRIGRIDLHFLEELAGLGEDDAAHSDEVAIEIHGTDERFEGVGQSGGALASAIGFFAASHHEVFADANALGQDAQPFAGDDAGADLGELAFAEALVLVEEVLGEDELENGVAEKLQALIIEMVALGFVAEAGMGERFRQEERIAEFVFDALFERIHEGITAGTVHGRSASGKCQVGALTRHRVRVIPERPDYVMPEKPPPPSAVPGKNPWPRVVTILGVLALLLGAGAWVVHRVTSVTGEAFGQGRAIMKEAGEQAANVARAFHEGTIREEFLSRSAEITGTNRLQVATLHQNETFQRSEQDNLAWGMIQLPKVVVQAQAPVEYTYYVDLKGAWDFRQQDKEVVVLAPPILPNTPAIDISALTFYTLEGSIWRDDKAVRERLRGSLTATLSKRAREDERLVREVGRQKIAEFVEQWLGDKFGDGHDYKVKVLFPGETPAAPPKEKAWPATPGKERP